MIVARWHKGLMNGWIALQAAIAIAVVASCGAAKVPNASEASHAGPVLLNARWQDDTSLSPVVYPQQRIALHFDHAGHAARGLSCAACHQLAERSDQASDRLLPRGKACDRCHGSDHGHVQVQAGPGKQGACSTCHEQASVSDGLWRMHIPTPQMRFSHRAHARNDIACERCHEGVQRVALATREHLPSMGLCFECHRASQPLHGRASTACATCHLSHSGGRLQTDLPTGKLLPPRWLGGAEHTALFRLNHGAVAANDSRFCASCHTEAQCSACHDGRVRPRDVHPNDYLSMHATDARLDSNRCSSCHRETSFCKQCHLRAGVTMSGPSWQRRSQGRFHAPPELFSAGPINSQHHSLEARRNLGACVSCHTESDCVMCHGARRGGGGMVSPHGAGFSGRCASALARNPRPCLVCHDPDDAALARCR